MIESQTTRFHAPVADVSSEVAYLRHVTPGLKPHTWELDLSNFNA